MIARRIFIVALIALSAALLLSCSKNEPESKSAGVRITGAGATFPEPLYKKWIEQYTGRHPDVSISYKGVGSGEGIKRFIKGEVDFGASDAAMNDEEIAMVDRGVKLIPATAGIIVLAYNLGSLDGELRLPRQVYADIFLGKIKYWSDPRIKKANPGLNLPSREIVPVTRQDASGTTFAFTNHLSAISEEWRNRGPGAGKVIEWPCNHMVARGNEGVAGKIKMSVGSIGYVEYGYAARAGLAMAWLENRAGSFVRPMPDSGSDTLANTVSQMPENMRLFMPDPPGKDSYPIVTYTWLLLYGKYPDAKKTAALEKFLQWGIKEGQQYGPALGYCPLPSGVVERARKALNEIQ
jgi:phosphate transport system substrate-binding protein